MSKTAYVYILASRPYGTLYVGLTSDLVRRVYEHREGVIAGFTATYKVRRLVHYEAFGAFPEAYARERRLKRWKRDWKLQLIEQHNPHWQDLWPVIAQP